MSRKGYKIIATNNKSLKTGDSVLDEEKIGSLDTSLEENAIDDSAIEGVVNDYLNNKDSKDEFVAIESISVDSGDLCKAFSNLNNENFQINKPSVANVDDNEAGAKDDTHKSNNKGQDKDNGKNSENNKDSKKLNSNNTKESQNQTTQQKEDVSLKDGELSKGVSSNDNKNKSKKKDKDLVLPTVPKITKRHEDKTEGELLYEENVVESVLFTMGASVEISEIALALGSDNKCAEAAAERLRLKYEERNAGMRVQRLDNKYQMVSSPKYYESLIQVAAHPKKPVLTETLLEILSIVAYKQPVTKKAIEFVRGVNPDYAVNKLMEYHLIEEVGRLEGPGRPALFGTTEEFLRRYGIDSKEHLPSITPEKIAQFEIEAETEVSQSQLTQNMGDVGTSLGITEGDKKDDLQELLDRTSVDSAKENAGGDETSTKTQESSEASNSSKEEILEEDLEKKNNEDLGQNNKDNLLKSDKDEASLTESLKKNLAANNEENINKDSILVNDNEVKALEKSNVFGELESSKETSFQNPVEDNFDNKKMNKEELTSSSFDLKNKENVGRDNSSSIDKQGNVEDENSSKNINIGQSDDISSLSGLGDNLEETPVNPMANKELLSPEELDKKLFENLSDKNKKVLLEVYEEEEKQKAEEEIKQKALEGKKESSYIEEENDVLVDLSEKDTESNESRNSSYSNISQNSLEDSSNKNLDNFSFNDRSPSIDSQKPGVDNSIKDLDNKSQTLDVKTNFEYDNVLDNQNIENINLKENANISKDIRENETQEDNLSPVESSACKEIDAGTINIDESLKVIQDESSELAIENSDNLATKNLSEETEVAEQKELQNVAQKEIIEKALEQSEILDSKNLSQETAVEEQTEVKNEIQEESNEEVTEKPASIVPKNLLEGTEVEEQNEIQNELKEESNEEVTEKSASIVSKNLLEETEVEEQNEQQKEAQVETQEKEQDKQRSYKVSDVYDQTVKTSLDLKDDLNGNKYNLDNSASFEGVDIIEQDENQDNEEKKNSTEKKGGLAGVFSSIKETIHDIFVSVKKRFFG